MNRLYIVGPMAAFIALAGCNAQNLADIIKGVQENAKTVCSFVPAAETISAIVVNAAFPEATPLRDIVSSIVKQLCAIKMAHRPASHVGASPMVIVVNGKTVPIHGLDTATGKSF